MGNKGLIALGLGLGLGLGGIFLGIIIRAVYEFIIVPMKIADDIVNLDEHYNLR